jgi:polyhydroxybutyrate depolymerase
MSRISVVLACLLLASLLFQPARLIHAALVSSPTPTVTDWNALLEPGRHAVSFRVDEHDRKFILVTPQGFKPGQALPLVFFLHGAGGSAEGSSRTYGWAEKAEAETFFAVFPEALPRRPDSGGHMRIWRNERPGHPVDVNDSHFFAVLLDRLEATLPIDSHRIYVTGFSNGAAMSFTLGAHFSDRIAAIAPVSSQSFATAATLARPLPVYYLTGGADPIIPYQGGASELGGSYPPVQDSVDFWVRLDGCPPQPQVLRDQDGVRVLRYGPGAKGSEIIFTTIKGNGHHWPGSREPLPRVICGPTLDPFPATDRIWDFFQAHPLP